MNVNLFKEQLISDTGANFAWIEEEQDNPNITDLSTDLYCREYRNQISINVVAFNNGTLFVNFIFGGINFNEDTLRLANNFNSKVQFLKAVVVPARRGHLLVVQKETNTESVDSAVKEVKDTIESLMSDDVVKHLQPLDIIVG